MKRARTLRPFPPWRLPRLHRKVQVRPWTAVTTPTPVAELRALQARARGITSEEMARRYTAARVPGAERTRS